MRAGDFHVVDLASDLHIAIGPLVRRGETHAFDRSELHEFGEDVSVVHEFEEWPVEPVLRAAAVTQGFRDRDKIGGRLERRQAKMRITALIGGQGRTSRRFRLFVIRRQGIGLASPIDQFIERIASCRVFICRQIVGQLSHELRRLSDG